MPEASAASCPASFFNRSKSSRPDFNNNSPPKPPLSIFRHLLNKRLFHCTLCPAVLTDRSFKEIMRPLLLHPTTLWRGTLPTILRNVPGTSLYFYSLSYLRQSLIPQAARSGRSSKYVTLVNVSAGMVARAGVGFILMPVSVLKVRFESNLYNYTSLARATADIFKREGFRGFFYGFGATALRDAPYAGIHVALYEATKALLGGNIP